ncbi:pre-mRNA-splicing factor SYF1, putative [Plasmodium chabaudi chabaudi]|uniref:Pre-mRNA-splicing factor SYF1, putative n=1 Tax=Plasmodium chabaudi chabaudi TaxID=31271 RepID=A0A1D3S4V0_PLACU|nr:pre-mRNA-splicing factor SYF1, putative [Plasmodium chabaudi chabaudi]
MNELGNVYDCDLLFNDDDRTLEGDGNNCEDTVAWANEENESYLKNIDFDIKNNMDKISTQYLFLYINTYKEKNIKNTKKLYNLKFYDIHLRKDEYPLLETEHNIVEYCINELINKENEKNEFDSLQKNDNNSNDTDEEHKYYLLKIYETILKHFPYSFKIWYHYIKDSIEMISDIYYNNKKEYEKINNIFENCLLYLYNFKSIYIMYIQFLYIQRNVKKIREVFNKSLQNICLNQHEDIWNYQLKFISKIDSKLINYEYIKRYVTIYPEQVIFLFNHYIKYKMHKQALSTFFYILNNDDINFDLGDKTKYDLYKEIFNLINSSKMLNNDVMEILRKNLDIFKNYENITSIYILLANNFVYEGRWNKAMDIYEEGISESYSINDFSVLFDNYIETLKVLIDLKIRGQDGNAIKLANKTDHDEETDESESENEMDISDDSIIDLYMDKINYLLDKRKIYIADIKLKNNKNNVYAWLSKIDVIDNENEKINLFNQCLKFFKDNDYTGKLSDVYITYAYYYYNNNNYKESVNVFHKAIEDTNIKSLNEMANIFCSWIELEILEKNYNEALQIARLSIDFNKTNNFDKKGLQIVSYNSDRTSIRKDNSTYGFQNVQNKFNLKNSIKLVCLVLDMEINYGTVETALCMFDLLYHSKSITIKMVLSFANYLYEQKYFNECFKVYEKAISIFHYPYLYPIYVNYINKYIERYKDKNISYVRELFKQAIYGTDNKTYVPKEFSKYIFLMYISFEENYGFLKKSLSIYKEAIPFLEEQDKIKFYKIFISKISKSYGIHKAREAFEEAIQTLTDDQAREICLLYIDMEYKLNEYDRVRALYVYTAQFTNPLKFPKFFQDWREFEALYGNEHTFRDMIRIKRSVRSMFTNSNSASFKDKHEETEEGKIEDTKRKLMEIIENETAENKKLKKI